MEKDDLKGRNVEPNGKGITEQELRELPEVKDFVLWQEEDGPTTVTDSQGDTWFIGFYDGKLSKCMMR